MQKQIISIVLKSLVNSVIAGIIIAIAAISFLFVSEILGLVVLSLGILIPLLYGYDVFLSKLTFITENKGPYIIETLVSILGNLIGTLIVSLIMLAIINENGMIAIKNNLNVINNIYESNNYFICIILSFFSGILYYFGVNTYKKAEQPIARFLVLILCIVAIGALGFFLIPFSVTYFVAHGFIPALWGKMFTILFGNVLGVLVIPFLRKLRNKF